MESVPVKLVPTKIVCKVVLYNEQFGPEIELDINDDHPNNVRLLAYCIHVLHNELKARGLTQQITKF